MSSGSQLLLFDQKLQWLLVRQFYNLTANWNILVHESGNLKAQRIFWQKVPSVLRQIWSWPKCSQIWQFWLISYWWGVNVGNAIRGDDVVLMLFLWPSWFIATVVVLGMVLAGLPFHRVSAPTSVPFHTPVPPSTCVPPTHAPRRQKAPHTKPRLEPGISLHTSLKGRPHLRSNLAWGACLLDFCFGYSLFFPLVYSSLSFEYSSNLHLRLYHHHQGIW